MSKYFNEDKWNQVTQNTDWYIQLYPELKKLRQRWEDKADTSAAAIKEDVRRYFERSLQNGDVALANSGPDLDKERRPIDTIIIHHTSAKPGYRLSYMNAVQLLNVYVPYFANPSSSIPGEKRLRGSPLWSNHVHDGRPVFYLYHWLMRMDGSFERLLEDKELGWHAANWEVNCRSIAICLDNDYGAANPALRILQQLAAFIRKQYPDIKTENIFGHSEVSRRPTICPGSEFMPTWKRQLIERLGA